MKKNIESSVILSQGSSKKWPQHVIAHTDGASRGNPGEASLGLCVHDSKGELIFEEAQNIGVETNNVAEYRGVHRALELAVQNKVKKLYLKIDSLLIVKQLKGEYKIKAPHLKPLYMDCLKLIKEIPHFSISHVRREQNKRADELANLALDT